MVGAAGIVRRPRVPARVRVRRQVLPTKAEGRKLSNCMPGTPWTTNWLDPPTGVLRGGSRQDPCRPADRVHSTPPLLAAIPTASRQLPTTGDPSPPPVGKGCHDHHTVRGRPRFTRGRGPDSSCSLANRRLVASTENASLSRSESDRILRPDKDLPRRRGRRAGSFLSSERTRPCTPGSHSGSVSHC